MSQSGEVLTVKGKLGEMTMNVHSSVTIKNTDNILTFFPVESSQVEEKDAWAQAGTTRANTFNLIKGVTDGWEKKLTLIGVGYRAEVRGKVLSLKLGFSDTVVIISLCVNTVIASFSCPEFILRRTSLNKFTILH